MTGEMATPSAAVTTSARNKAVETPSISRRVSSGEWRFLCSASTGTKACEKAPSANRRRSRFGMRKATKNASVARPAPKARAMKKSRTYPRMRETSVRLDIAKRARSRFMLEFAPFSVTQPHGQHQIRAQARQAGARAPRAQRGASHQRAQRDQESHQGGSRGQQGSGARLAARIPARDRPHRRQGHPASQRRRPSQEPPRARHQGTEVAYAVSPTRCSSASLVRSSIRPSRTLSSLSFAKLSRNR